MNNRPARSALKYFTKTIRRMIKSVEYGRGEQLLSNFCVHFGTVLVRMGCMLELKEVTKGNFHSVAIIARWFCNNGYCLCDRNNWTTTLHHDDCVKERLDLHGKDGCPSASCVIR